MKIENARPQRSANKLEKIAKKLTTLLGLTSAVSFIGSFLIFETLRPKMISFQKITFQEESLLNFFGITLLSFLAFCLLVFYQLIKHFIKAKKIAIFYLFLLATNVTALVFIFSDLALISDIGKQYKYGLDQPEWLVLYLVMAGQLFSALILTWANHYKLGKGKQLKYIARDSNIFIIAQYIGVICGFMGLAFTSLNFLFPRSLSMIKLHVCMTSVFLIIPYLLIVGCWFLIKIREKPKGWYDEKQIQDIGMSSFITLVLSLVIMGSLFLLTFHQSEAVLSVIWLPFYFFLVLLTFSLGNLYFSQKH